MKWENEQRYEKKKLALNVLNPSTTSADSQMDMKIGIVNCDILFYLTVSGIAIYDKDSISS